MADSEIGWTDKVWNVTRGCRRISPGCGGPKGIGGCYAERTAYRFSGEGQPYEGLVQLTAAGPRWTGRGRFVAEKLAEPLRWRKPARVFVDSMSDLFFEAFTNDQIAAAFGVMAACQQHTFQVLTKRIRRAREWFAWLEERVESAAEEWSGRDCAIDIHEARKQCILEYLDETATAALAGHFDACHLGLTTNSKLTWPLKNVHLGVSVENQDAADERIPDLLATPAVVRFLSCEPLLGPVDLRKWMGRPARCTTKEPCAACSANNGTLCRFSSGLPDLSWIIGGCESGPGARRADVTWFESLAEQCRDSGTPFFMKQMIVDGVLVHDLADFPPSLRFQDFPA